jgi:hypothetical protein
MFDEAQLHRVLKLRFLLQAGPDPSLNEQECAGFSALPQARLRRSHPNSGSAASPIRPDLALT